MDSVIGTIIGKLLELGVSEELFLIFLFLLFCYSLFQKYFRPIKENVERVPDQEYHNKIEKINEEERRILYDRLVSIEESLNNIQKYMIDSDFNSKILIKESEKLNQELQQVKSIISQFQGHMMYGRSDVFGNREIR